jgi:hypothetical protein
MNSKALQSHSFDELLEMYMEAVTILYDSKINEEAAAVNCSSIKFLVSGI